METYKFPEGTKKLTKKQILEAARKYEKLEIPGSVHEVKIELGNEVLPLKELFFHEGVHNIFLVGDAGEPISYNIPQSLLLLRGGWGNKRFRAPRVACFPQSLQNAWYFGGIEYLQAYKDCDVRFFDGDELKHYVYLGDGSSRLKDVFSDIPQGCVIHVENKKVALSTLKKVDVDKVYVIPDAKEWKDFPADKLALTREEYDPESRILPKQIEMREEKRRKEAEEAPKQQEKERKERKDMMVASMAKPIIESAFCPLCDKVQVASISQENANGEDVIKARLLISDIQWITSDDKTVSTEFDIEIPLSDVAYNAEKAVAVVKQLKDVFDRNQQLMQSMGIRLNIIWIPKENTRPMLVLPVGNGNSISAYLNWDTMTEDSKAMRGFVKELTEIVETAKTEDGILIDIKLNEGFWL